MNVPSLRSLFAIDLGVELERRLLAADSATGGCPTSHNISSVSLDVHRVLRDVGALPVAAILATTVISFATYD
jgi:hypothetical protein